MENLWRLDGLVNLITEYTFFIFLFIGPPALMTYLGCRGKIRWDWVISSILWILAALFFFNIGFYASKTFIEAGIMGEQSYHTQGTRSMVMSIFTSLICGGILAISLKGKRRLAGIAFALILSAAFYFLSYTQIVFLVDDLVSLAAGYLLSLFILVGPPALMIYLGCRGKIQWGWIISSILWILAALFFINAYFYLGTFIKAMNTGWLPPHTPYEVIYLLPEYIEAMAPFVFASLIYGGLLTISLKGKQRLAGVAFALTLTVAYYFSSYTQISRGESAVTHAEESRMARWEQNFKVMEQNRLLWQFKRPVHYRYTVRRLCSSCLRSKVYQGVTIEVLNDQPVESTSDDYYTDDYDTMESYNTIEKIFKRIENVRFSGVVEVVYDPVLGYPQYVHFIPIGTQYSKPQEDYWIIVDALESLPPAPPLDELESLPPAPPCPGISVESSAGPQAFTEEFDQAERFAHTSNEVTISNGRVDWEIDRSGGEQFVYCAFPAFSGDVRLTATGQIDHWTNNCVGGVGIGDAPGSGAAIYYGFYGGGCAPRGRRS